MKKRLPLVMLLCCLAVFAQAQVGQDMYKSVSESVVFIQHSFYLRVADCSKPELWRRYEALTKENILNTEHIYMSGSGFFLDSDGYILTNRHVARIGSVVSARRDLIYWMKESLEKKYKTNFTSTERETMNKDFSAMMLNGKYSLYAVTGDKKKWPAELLAITEGKEPDLALLKIPAGPYRGIKLAPSASIAQSLVGTEVLSFGFPLDNVFKERAVTMNRGTVSAIRLSDEFAIQHSAAISRGNSGGPLVNLQGAVVGVNTASLQENSGNGLFYATDAAKIHDFLKNKGYRSVDLWNGRIADPAEGALGVKLNALGEIEVSANVVINVDKNVEVVVDGKPLGKGPQFFNPVNPLSELEVKEGENGYKAKLRLLSGVSESTELKFKLEKRAIPFKLESSPSGATVIADGKVLGNTPLDISLAADDYSFKFKKDGSWYPDKSARVGTGQPASLSIVGDVGIPVTFLDKPNEKEAIFRFESERGYCSFSSDEKIYLSKGKWKMKIEGSPAYAEYERDFEVSGSPLTLDLAQAQAQTRKTASLKVIGLDPKAKLWIDDKYVAAHEGEIVQVPLGIHYVYVWKNGKEPMAKTRITIRPDDSAFVTWDRSMGHDVKRNGKAVTAGVFGALGAGIFALQFLTIKEGTQLADGSVATESISLSSSEKIIFSITGVSVAGISALIGFDALKENAKYAKQLEYMKSLENANE